MAGTFVKKRFRAGALNGEPSPLVAVECVMVADAGGVVPPLSLDGLSGTLLEIVAVAGNPAPGSIPVVVKDTWGVEVASYTFTANGRYQLDPILSIVDGMTIEIGAVNSLSEATIIPLLMR
jgi:hypothetical protein